MGCGHPCSHSSVHKGVIPLSVPLFPLQDPAHSTDPPALVCGALSLLTTVYRDTPQGSAPTGPNLVLGKDQCREMCRASWHRCQGTRGALLCPWHEGKPELQPLLRCETRGSDALQMKGNHTWFHFLSHSCCPLFPLQATGTAHGEEGAQKRFYCKKTPPSYSCRSQFLWDQLFSPWVGLGWLCVLAKNSGCSEGVGGSSL